MVSDIIDQLYFGELHPSRGCIPEGLDLEEETLRRLRAVSARAFRCGFALGAQLMLEIDET